MPMRVFALRSIVALVILALAVPQVAAEASADRGVFEAWGNIRQEITEILQDFWCMLTGRGCEQPRSETEPDEADELPVVSAMVHAPMDLGPLLQSFCGMDISNGPVDCGCCADHFVEPIKVAALLHGSTPVEAAAWERNDKHVEKRLGRVMTWSVGGRTPTVWCDRGRPACRCEDQKLNWDEDEAACREGKPCMGPKQAEERMNPGEDQKQDIQTQDRQLLQDATDAEVEGCLHGDASRIPIGFAQCEDMSPRLCNRLYANGPRGWHFCTVISDAPRICSARQRAEDANEVACEGLEQWGIQQAYNPSLGWETEIDEERLSLRVKTSPRPPPEQVRAHLRERISAAAMASTLRVQHETSNQLPAS